MGWRARLRAAMRLRLPGGRRRRTRPARRRAAGEWWRQPHAPRFSVDPGSDELPDGRTVRVLMTFRQRAGHDVEASLRARWRGAGIRMEPAAPLRDVRERTYQLHPAIADPLETGDGEIEAGQVAFEIEFRWQGAVRHCLWLWPLRQRRDGRWVLLARAADTDAPTRRW